MLAISRIWVTIGPIIVINTVLLISFLSYHMWFGRRLKREYAGAKNQGSKFLSTTTREWWFWTTDPIVRFFVRAHISPNLITIIGVCISAIAGVLFGFGLFGYAGWVMMFGASFDMFDGRVARMTGKTTRSGAFFDSVTDRIGEGMCFLGLALYFRDSWMLAVVIAALIGSSLVSYTRARGEAMGVSCAVGSMQRPERIVYLGVASIFDPIISVGIEGWWKTTPPILVIAALIFIAVMTIGTSIYRMLYVMNVLDGEDFKGKESLPQLITKLITHEGREELWDRARYGYDRTKSQFAHVVLFHAGQVDRDFFMELISKGELNNICRHIVERGGAYEGSGAFPSASGPAITPFVTGCFPGTCDIPAVRWFDRTIPEGRVLTINRFRDYLGWGAYAMDHDLAKSVRTIFEYSRQAANIFGVLNRGCGFVRDPAFFRIHSKYHHLSSSRDIDEADEVAFTWFLNAMRRETDFVLYSFPTMCCARSKDVSPDEKKDAYRKLDAYVGMVADFLKKNGLYEETALMFCADAGQGPSRKRFDLFDFVSSRYSTCPTGGRMRDWHEKQAVALVSGTSMAHVYLRNGDRWSNKIFFEDIERRGLVGSLLETGHIDVLAGRSVDGGTIVQTDRGRAHVLEDADGRITYIVKGSDPFGLSNTRQVMSTAEAFDATFDSNYPDGIVQMIQLFRSERTGDLVISTKPDVSMPFDPQYDMKGATFGSLNRQHMLVPVLSSVAFERKKIRTADVFATVLEMLGMEGRHDMDGVAVGLGSAIASSVAADRGAYGGK